MHFLREFGVMIILGDLLYSLSLDDPSNSKLGYYSAYSMRRISLSDPSSVLHVTGNPTQRNVLILKMLFSMWIKLTKNLKIASTILY